MRPPLRLLVLGVLTVIGAIVLLLVLRRPVEAPTAEPSASGAPPTIDAGIPAPEPAAWDLVAWEPIDGPFRPDGPTIVRMDGIVDAEELIVGWGRASTPARNQFNEMGAVFVTGDGLDWHTVLIEHGVGPADTSEVAGIAFGPEGLLAWGGVCCETETRALWLSQDGLAWTRVQVEGDLDRTSGFRKVVGVPGGWIAVGSEGAEAEAAIWSSTDGSVWDAIDLDDAGLGTSEIADVANGTDGLVAVGTVEGPGGTHDGGIWASPDGREWQRIGADDPVLAGPDETELWKVIPFAGGLFVIGHFGATEDRKECEDLLGMLASADPTPPKPTALSCGWGREHQWVSNDGHGWERVDPAALPGEHPIEFRVIAAGGPGLLNLGESSGPESPDTALFASDDGIRWVAIDPPHPLAPGVAIGLVALDRGVLAITDQLDGAGPSVRIWLGTAN